MFRNVLERRRELALLRAVGYDAGNVTLMIVAESVLLLGTWPGGGSVMRGRGDCSRLARPRRSHARVRLDRAAPRRGGRRTVVVVRRNARRAQRTYAGRAARRVGYRLRSTRCHCCASRPRAHSSFFSRLRSSTLRTGPDGGALPAPASPRSSYRQPAGQNGRSRSGRCRAVSAMRRRLCPAIASTSSPACSSRRH